MLARQATADRSTYDLRCFYLDEGGGHPICGTALKRPISIHRQFNEDLVYSSERWCQAISLSSNVTVLGSRGTHVSRCSRMAGLWYRLHNIGRK
jgi:hypothetical protein